MELITISAPDVEPLQQSDVEGHARTDDSAAGEGADIAQFIAQARAWAEAYTRRRFITQTVRFHLSGFPCEIVCPVAPVQSVSQITYIDAAGVEQTLSPASYKISRSRGAPRIVRSYGMEWPTPRDELDNVAVDLVVGYGATGSALPPDVIGAIRFMAAHFYENREAVSETTLAEVPLGARDMLAPHRFWF